jgi:hypothetical protein
MMKRRLFLCLFFLAAMFASASIVFPEPPLSGNKETLIVQLVAKNTQVQFRKPATFYARFINQSDVLQELPMGIPPRGTTRFSSVQWHPAANVDEPRKLGYPGTGGPRQESPILAAKGTLVIKLPEKLLPCGKHEMSLAFLFNGKEIKSNSVTVTVVDQPLSAQEIRDLRYGCDLILHNAILEDYGRNPWFKEIVFNKMVIGSPYSVDILKKALTCEPSQFPKHLEDKHLEFRRDAAEILGLIADKERAAKIGYIRDTSAADLVIERIGKESDAPVKAALLKIVGKFFDVLDQPQREKLEKSGLVQLSHQDAGVRVQSALMLLEWFPKRLSSIEKALAKPAFCDDSGRKQIADTLAKVKAKLPQ